MVTEVGWLQFLLGMNEQLFGWNIAPRKPRPALKNQLGVFSKCRFWFCRIGVRAPAFFMQFQVLLVLLAQVHD